MNPIFTHGLLSRKSKLTLIYLKTWGLFQPLWISEDLGSCHWCDKPNPVTCKLFSDSFEVTERWRFTVSYCRCWIPWKIGLFLSWHSTRIHRILYTLWTRMTRKKQNKTWKQRTSISDYYCWLEIFSVSLNLDTQREKEKERYRYIFKEREQKQKRDQAKIITFQ